MVDELLEQRRVGTTEEALGGGGAVGTTDVEVVRSGERRKLALTEAVATMMILRQLAVAPLHGRTAALEQIAHSTATCSIHARTSGARACSG